MANYTSNYNLHQWEPGDNFLRTDFNEDFAKIDAAIAAKPDHSDITAAVTLCRAVTGSYTGNDASEREIVLGFRPKAVFLQEEENLYSSLAVDGGPSVWAVLPRGGPVLAMELTDRGFKVHRVVYTINSLGDTSEVLPYTNRSGKAYGYLAFR